MIVPFVVLLGGLFALNMRPETAALYAVLALFLLSLVRTYDGGRIRATVKGRGTIEVSCR